MAAQDSLERLHAELMGTLRRLPTNPAMGVQRFGPAADEVERFISLLRDQPATVWERAEEYRHNLELNPAVHEELVSKHPSLLDLGKRTSAMQVCEHRRGGHRHSAPA